MEIKLPIRVNNKANNVDNKANHENTDRHTSSDNAEAPASGDGVPGQKKNPSPFAGERFSYLVIK